MFCTQFATRRELEEEIRRQFDQHRTASRERCGHLIDFGERRVHQNEHVVGDRSLSTLTMDTRVGVSKSWKGSSTCPGRKLSCRLQNCQSFMEHQLSQMIQGDLESLPMGRLR
mmetsp:Transcript_16888/g.34992  ORF Transcript_16888/g.34992 Transcript_16888/m.34992 type:complete len:113 (+) Transcript_16888:652-990(+)